MPDIKIHDSKSEIWDDFTEEIDNNFESVEPGSLSKELARICERSGSFELDAQRIMYLSENSNWFLELLEKNERIGFLLLHLPKWGDEATIELVCVSLAEKGKNYSRRLIDEAKRLAKEAGKKRLLLEALDRTIGEKVYKKQGFEFVNEKGMNMIHQLGGRRRGKTRKMKRKA